MLKNTFIPLLGRYTGDQQLIESMWAEVVLHYSESGRYYHNYIVWLPLSEPQIVQIRGMQQMLF